jgi:hypothetical protein
VGFGLLVTIADIAIVAVMALYFLSLVRPWRIHERGPVIRREAVTLLGRLRMLWRPLLMLVGLAVAGWRLGYASAWAIGAVFLGSLALVAAPVAYTLTPEGIRLGRLPLRRWTEFAGVARRRWSVRLPGVGARGMTVWLSGDRDDDEFVLLLRQLVRGSYQGWIDPGAGDATDLGPDPARGLLERQGQLAAAAAPGRA